MKALKLTITLHEPVSWATRQVMKMTITEPLIHPWALGFALGLDGMGQAPKNPYITGQTTRKDKRGKEEVVSDTGGPAHRAMLSGSRMRLSAALPEGTAGSLIRTLQRGNEGYQNAPDGLFKDKNILLIAKSKEMAAGTVLVAYALPEPGYEPQLPRWIRLGRWMSKARVETEVLEVQPRSGPWDSPVGLTLSDAPADLDGFELVSMSPEPLVRGLSGDGPHLSDGKNLILPWS